MQHVAENALSSCLQTEQAPVLDRLVAPLLTAVEGGNPIAAGPAVRELMAYLDTLDEASYHLKNRMRNLALRRDLLPWIEALDDRIWMGRAAIRTLEAIENGMNVESPLHLLQGLVEDVQGSPKRIGGTSLLALGVRVQQRAGAGTRT